MDRIALLRTDLTKWTSAGCIYVLKSRTIGGSKISPKRILYALANWSMSSHLISLGITSEASLRNLMMKDDGSYERARHLHLRKKISRERGGMGCGVVCLNNLKHHAFGR